jgi:uncharacterized protein (TIGR02246 family)
MKLGLAVLTLLLVAPIFTLSQTTGSIARSKSDAKEEEAIAKVLGGFVDAWNKHDAKSFSMVFAEDADFTNVRGIGAKGRTEIEKFHAPLFSTMFKDSHQKIIGTKIRFIKPDVAAVDVRWEMTGAKNPEGKDIPLRKGLLNFVMTKEKESWLITVMHNMDLPVTQ